MQPSFKKIEKDIVVFYVEATSFPDGIVEAFTNLKNILGPIKNTTFYGISKPEKNKGIVYKAAASISSTNIENINLPRLIIPAGNYYSIHIADYTTDISQFTKAFENLLAQPQIATDTFCIEVYNNDNPNEATCLVKKAD